jgi:hypothetical protein
MAEQCKKYKKQQKNAPLNLIFGNPEESFTNSDLSDKKHYVRALRQRIDAAAAFARKNLTQYVMREQRIHLLLSIARLRC